MFSPDIVSSDAFLEMSATARDLYFQLGMFADDDGFVNPRKYMRMLGSSEDDLKILLGKRFLLPFQSGVVVVKHWKINNLVRKDWYRPTQYLEEKKLLYIKENGVYTDNPDNGIPLVNDSLTVRPRRLGKVSIETTESLRSSDLPLEEVFVEEEKKPTKEPKDPRAKKITTDFRARCRREFGREPSWSLLAGWAVVGRALKKTTESNLKDMMDEWFDSSKEPGDMMQITQCFSPYRIDKYLSQYA